MLKRKNIYLSLTISLIVVWSLLLMGAAGCPTTQTQTYTLAVNVSPSGGGSVSPSGGSYDSGMTVAITATASSGYVFDYWSGSASGTNPTTTIVMDSNKNVTANFTATGAGVGQTYNLTVNRNPSWAGTVFPAGGICEAGVEVTITAEAEDSWTFSHWSGDASGTNPIITIIMDSDKNITANFTTAGAAFFSDSFSQDTGNWAVGSDENGDVFYEGGWLHLLNYTTAPSSTITTTEQYFDDFSLEVDTKLVDGTDDNWQIVICRWQDPDNYYYFGISADGYYLIGKFVNGEETFIESSDSPFINQGVGAVNTMSIVCISSNLSLLVNGNLLTTVIDSTFYGGYIGLAATSMAGGFTEIAFDNLIITEEERD